MLMFMHRVFLEGVKPFRQGYDNFFSGVSVNSVASSRMPAPAYEQRKQPQITHRPMDMLQGNVIYENRKLGVGHQVVEWLLNMHKAIIVPSSAPRNGAQQYTPVIPMDAEMEEVRSSKSSTS